MKKTYPESTKLKAREYRKNHTIAETAKQFKVSVNTIYNWEKSAAKTRETSARKRTVAPITPTEVTRLARENSKLRRFIVLQNNFIDALTTDFEF